MDKDQLRISFEDELTGRIANEDARAATLDEGVNDEESASTIHPSAAIASTSTTGDDRVADMTPSSRKINIADGLCHKDQTRSMVRPGEQRERHDHCGGNAVGTF